ncbi:unnamed protein product [Owenia fusiformis]|uniref:N-acetyltransferase domain-containing protein n=1 Tax=Owenia fusiformis TaxID=6347 RepID=A0A8J1U4J2_OWEFU|nr:unnamed protein product [Owenia fusiformis]
MPFDIERVSIRKYRRSDHGDVLSLFKKGKMDNISDAIKFSLSCRSVLLMLLYGEILTYSIYGSVSSAALLCILLVAIIIASAVHFENGHINWSTGPNGDLNNILGVYFQHGGTLLVAEYKESVIGMCGLTQQLDHGAKTDIIPGTMEIRKLNVLGAYRQKGVATKLLHAIFRHANTISCKQLVIGVHEYPKIVEFWKKLGFKRYQGFPMPFEWTWFCPVTFAEYSLYQGVDHFVLKR